MDGILLVKKEAGITSRDVVNQVGKLLNMKKIGHTGTLDPLATGVLVLCLGNCSKLAELITAEEKEYVAQMILGIETETLDNTSPILKEENIVINREQLLSVFEAFIGTYNQEVPIYSAVKIKGRKLYEYARNKEEVELPKREVTIKELELLDGPTFQNGHLVVSFRTVVSKGTYIRSLIRDIAFSLGTVAVMSKLIRTKQGSYSLSDCQTIEQISVNPNLISKEEIFQNVPKVIMDETLELKVKNGQLLENVYAYDPVYFFTKDGILKAIYKKYEKDEMKIKPWKMF